MHPTHFWQKVSEWGYTQRFLSTLALRLFPVIMFLLTNFGGIKS